MPAHNKVKKMESRVSLRATDGHGLKLILRMGVAWLAQHVDAVNRMNVFPVPDGDTGINMYHTLKRAYQEIEPLESDDISLVARRFAHGALMGARGNSGTILSQLLKGFADGLDDNANLSPQLLLDACDQAVVLAYQSVNDPVEGTILTVARESSEALKKAYQSDMALDEMLHKLTSSAEQSLYNTPNLLPVLKEAGVVDSGGMGLFFFLQGMTRYNEGETDITIELPENIGTQDTPDWETSLIPDDEEGYGYDVQFLMLADHMDVESIRSDFEAMGWSVLVVGDSSMLKVHIHVHNPADPIGYAINLGAELDDIVVENMHLQYQAYVRNRQQAEANQYQIPAHGIAVVSVASGDGIADIFRDLNCTHVIAGGQTMNPSTEDFLNIIDRLPTDKIVLMPNNSNIILTAQQAAKLSTNKQIRIVPTKTVLQGITAMIEYGGESRDDMTLDEMADRMTESLDYVVSVEITRAIRSTQFDGQAVTNGHFLGIVDGKIEASLESLEATVMTVLKSVAEEDYELATLYYGEEISENDANQLIERLSKAIKGLEFEAVHGGQPLYPYLISVE
jgi:DAK2 domain fusion protein YloV